MVATLTVTPCWCYGSETFDMDPKTIKAVWGFNGTERPGAFADVYSVMANFASARGGTVGAGVARPQNRIRAVILRGIAPKNLILWEDPSPAAQDDKKISGCINFCAHAARAPTFFSKRK